MTVMGVLWLALLLDTVVCTAVKTTLWLLSRLSGSNCYGGTMVGPGFGMLRLVCCGPPMPRTVLVSLLVHDLEGLVQSDINNLILVQ